MKEIQSNTTNRYALEDENFWQQHQTAFSASGTTRKAYCRSHQINYDRFGYWIKRLSTKSMAAATQDNLTLPQVTGLLPVKLKIPTRQDDSNVLCTINLRNGHVLHINDERALSLILGRWA